MFSTYLQNAHTQRYTYFRLCGYHWLRFKLMLSCANDTHVNNNTVSEGRKLTQHSQEANKVRVNPLLYTMSDYSPSRLWWIQKNKTTDAVHESFQLSELTEAQLKADLAVTIAAITKNKEVLIGPSTTGIDVASGISGKQPHATRKRSSSNRSTSHIPVAAPVDAADASRSRRRDVRSDRDKKKKKKKKKKKTGVGVYVSTKCVCLRFFVRPYVTARMCVYVCVCFVFWCVCLLFFPIAAKHFG